MNSRLTVTPSLVRVAVSVEGSGTPPVTVILEARMGTLPALNPPSVTVIVKNGGPPLVTFVHTKVHPPPVTSAGKLLTLNVMLMLSSTGELGPAVTENVEDQKACTTLSMFGAALLPLNTSGHDRAHIDESVETV